MTGTATEAASARAPRRPAAAADDRPRGPAHADVSAPLYSEPPTRSPPSRLRRDGAESGLSASPAPKSADITAASLISFQVRTSRPGPPRSAAARRRRRAGGRGGGRRISPRPDPIRPKTWSKSPVTARRWFCATAWNVRSGRARDLPNRANSPSALSSTAASICLRRRPFATSSRPPRCIRRAWPRSRLRVPFRAASPREGATARINRAARSRHRFRRGRYQRRSPAEFCAASIRSSRGPQRWPAVSFMGLVRDGFFTRYRRDAQRGKKQPV